MVSSERNSFFNICLRSNLVAILVLNYLAEAGSFTGTSSETIRSSCLKHGVIPDGIEDVPQFLCEVRYTRICFINLGNKIDPATCQRKPRSLYWPAKNDTYYALILLDLDVPTRRNPIYRDRQHWLVVNIPGNKYEEGEELTAYLGPVAPRNSGLHRYVFLVYEQPGKLTFDEKRLTDKDRESALRSCYSVKKFVDKYDLGKPYAGNFFLSGWPLNQS